MKTGFERLLPWRGSRPRLSIVVIVYDMPAQAARTLQSLAPPYQRAVDANEYEIIVVENESPRMLGEGAARAAAPNVRYFARKETHGTPVHAINFGAAQARASHLAVMIDGARMVTPGIVRLTLDAMRLSPEGAVLTPGYHIGHKLQQEAVDEGYDEVVEAQLMAGIGWPADGYRLFDISVLSGSCKGGFFLPIAESNFLATSLRKWNAIGGIDARYNGFGGGYANVDLLKRLVETPHTPCYMLFGEGTFHQFHGGVTTGTRAAERARIVTQIIEQDAALRADRSLPRIEPIYFGPLTRAALRFVRHSLDAASPGPGGSP